MWDDAVVDGSGIHLADMHYEVLIEEVEGGRHGRAGEPDKVISDRAAPFLMRLEKSGRLLQWHSEMGEQDLLERLDVVAPPDIVVTPPAPDLRFRHIEKGKENYYLLFNEGEKAIESMIRFKESGGLWLVDPFTLEQIPVPMNGHISLERHQLMFIRI